MASLNGPPWDAGALHAGSIDVRQTANVSAWRTGDGEIHVLAANLEEGFREDADRRRHVTMKLPPAWGVGRWAPVWALHGAGLAVKAGEMRLDLPAVSSVLVTGEGRSGKAGDFTGRGRGVERKKQEMSGNLPVGKRGAGMSDEQPNLITDFSIGKERIFAPESVSN